MTHLEQRLRERNLRLVNKTLISGAHAGNVYRIEALHLDGHRSSFIYKEFAEDRSNEVDIYRVLENYIKPFSKKEALWDSQPQAILMEDLGNPLKQEFGLSPFQRKIELIKKILERLAELHSNNFNEITNGIPTHQLTLEWYEWCLSQLKRLHLEINWAESGWMEIINDAYHQLGLSEYNPRIPLTLTHGDPHLENIFLKDEEIWLVDWEWAALGSPLRDITILCQDCYNSNLIQYIYDSYKVLIEKRGVNVPDEDYKSDFFYLYIDHTTMMLAWEIEKFFQGFATEERIRQIVSFKIGEVRRVITLETPKL
ncbi:phosphotransferase family protein [Bacillus sp. SCS-153A]|uniref:phosphotransferase family protein n=1 Tax=Rossellomorea sedimentorum TaxID=3115294 RepID=UPI003906661B